MHYLRSLRGLGKDFGTEWLLLMGNINTMEKDNGSLRIVYLKLKVNCQSQRASLKAPEKALVSYSHRQKGAEDQARPG